MEQKTQDGNGEEEIKKLLNKHPFYGYNKEWAIKYQSVQRMALRMMSRERRSFFTYRRYMEALRKFVEYLKLGDPDEALEYLMKEDATEIIDSFIGAISASDLSPRSIKSVFYGVQKWANANKLRVEWGQIGKPKTGGKIRDRIPTCEELQKILEFGHIRDKALFEILLSSGLRVGTVMSLKLKDYKEIEDCGIIFVEGGEGRKLSPGFWYWTFISREARATFENYLGWRRRNGEDLGPESPLISVIARGQSAGEPFRYANNVSRQWRRLVEKAGLDQKIKGTGWLEFHTHTIRKRFSTICKGAGVDQSYIDFWMGHTSGATLNDSYWRETVEKHFNEYKKAIPQLSVFEAKPVSEVEQRKRSMLDSARLFLSPDKYAQLENILAYAKTMEEVDEDIRNITAKLKELPPEEKRGIENITAKAAEKTKPEDEDCQKIVSEEDLGNHLSHGWRVAAVLPSGRVVIEHNGAGPGPGSEA